MIEDIRAAAERITFTHRDSSDFTATVTLDRNELKHLLSRMNEARAFMRPFDPCPVISCPLCETRHPEHRACKASDVRRADLRHDRMNAAARRKEMRQEMKDSLPRYPQPDEYHGS